MLGAIYQPNGKAEKADSHFKAALKIAIPSRWDDILFWTHYCLVLLFYNDGRFEDAQAHADHAKSHTTNSTYNLGRAVGMQASTWYLQHRFEEARSEALCAINIYEKLEAARDLEDCRGLLRIIQKGLNVPSS